MHGLRPSLAQELPGLVSRLSPKKSSRALVAYGIYQAWQVIYVFLQLPRSQTQV